MTSSYMPSCRHYYNYYFFLFALVLHSQGLKISKYANVCPEWLRWGLGNCERVGKVHCIETLNCHGNILVHECSFPWIGCAKHVSVIIITLLLLVLLHFKWLISVVSVCLPNNNFMKFIFADPVDLHGIRVKFVYEGHQVKATVTRAEKGQMLSCHPYA